jgi:hypothetical protein
MVALSRREFCFACTLPFPRSLIDDKDLFQKETLRVELSKT